MALTAGTFGALAASGWLELDARQSVTVTFLTLARRVYRRNPVEVIPLPQVSKKIR